MNSRSQYAFLRTRVTFTGQLDQLCPPVEIKHFRACCWDILRSVSSGFFLINDSDYLQYQKHYQNTIKHCHHTLFFCLLTGGVYIDCPNKNCSISISVLSLSFSHSLHLFCCTTFPSARCLPWLPDRFTSLSYIYTLFYPTSLLAVTFLSACIPLLSSLSVTSNRRYSSMMASRF